MNIPPDWTVIERRTVGPFTTSMMLQRPDDTMVEWSAWNHRKGHGLFDRAAPISTDRTSWWAPRSRGWWIAVLFIIGSSCFAVGSFPLTASLLGSAAGPVFFIGSIFFTTAAYLQYYEVTNEGDSVKGDDRTRGLLGLRPESLGWWASVVQLVGTLFFNLSTFSAMGDLSTLQEEALVWAPDALGSIAFLIASGLALVEVCGRLWCWKRESREWRIAGINMIGSIAFGISAVGALVLLPTGDLNNATVANSFTFIGAVMFFIGAALLIPAASSASGDRG